MEKIQAPQVKAARALLGWSQEDLAQAAKLSITTIRTMELGYTPRPKTLLHICRTIESHGLEFTDGDGVRRRDDEIRTIRGLNSCDRFFVEVMETIQKQGGDVLAVIKSEDVLTRISGAPHRTNLARLEAMQETVNVKCFMSSIIKPSFAAPSFPIRAIAHDAFSLNSFIVYGDKYAHIIPEGRLNFLIVVFSIAAVAEDYRKHFLLLWDTAPHHRLLTN